jgi:hypothetical protein
MFSVDKTDGMMSVNVKLCIQDDTFKNLVFDLKDTEIEPETGYYVSSTVHLNIQEQIFKYNLIIVLGVIMNGKVFNYIKVVRSEELNSISKVIFSKTI